MQPSRPTLVVEGSAGHADNKAFLSAAVTLTLGILGSSVLPIPFAFSRTGVLLGVIVAVLVSLANAFTGTLLLRAAGTLNKHSFESLAYAVGGPTWKRVTQISLVLLLFGTLCGDIALLADTGRIAAGDLFPGGAPEWLVAGDGRTVMAALVMVVVLPLSCMRRMRELERVAMAGVLMVVVLVGVVMYDAIDSGFPAIRSGDLPLARARLSRELPGAICVVSYAFYLQPMLLPILREMPAGKAGIDLTCRATQLVTTGVALSVYCIIGICAASVYGSDTAGDVLVNQWLPGIYDGVLDALMALYLSISMAPIAVTLRYQLDSLMVGDDAPPRRVREIAITALSLACSLAVALAFPTAAEQMFAITGATGVALVCYILPVGIHLRMRSLQQRGSVKPGGDGEGLAQRLLEGMGEEGAQCLPDQGVEEAEAQTQEGEPRAWAYTYDVVLPVAVAVAGTAVSLSALFFASVG